MAIDILDILLAAPPFTLGETPPPEEEVGPACGTVSSTFAVTGTVSIEDCDEGADMIAIGNDIPILLEGAMDEASGDYLNSATVAFTLYARNGTTVLSGPTGMNYVAASNGNYRGVLESSVVDALVTAGTVEIGQAYPVAVTLVNGTLDAEWWQNIPIGRRGWNC